MFSVRPMLEKKQRSHDFSWPMQNIKMAPNVSTPQEQYESSKGSRVISFHSTSKWKTHFEASKRTNRLVVIYFTATWCGPCRHMEPLINNFANLYPDVEFIKIDVDELMSVAEMFVVRTMPTFVLIKRGDVIDRVVGAKKDDLQMKIQKHRI
ncbi:oxidoreductase [Lithospermum erythrorhizon]|uniref:Oxidoreductase n=1 Tax=Lithospermum erythrorhizon TaxID=34254 RepID=A0AAV3P3H3_LITER